MAKQFKDQVEILEQGGEVVIQLDANQGRISAGGRRTNGNLRLADRAGNETVAIDARGTVSIRNSDGDVMVEIDGRSGQFLLRDAHGRTALRFVSNRGALELGSESNDGQVLLRNEAGATVVRLVGGRAELELGANGQPGAARLADGDGLPAIELEAASATLKLGREGNGGGLKLIDESGGMAFQVTGSFARMRGALTLGGRDDKGELILTDEIGRPAIYVDGGSAKLQLGNLGNAGDLVLLDNEAKPVFELEGLTATVALGGNDKPGHFVLRDGSGREVGRLNGAGASLLLGRSGRGGEILVLDSSGKACFSVDGANSTVVVGRGEGRIVLDGGIGDIQLPGADCAEAFDTEADVAIEPGTVLVVAGEDRLRPSSRAYDRRVAGVVSGAGGIRPGIVLNRTAGEDSRSPVALSGKVYCKVDAGPGTIDLGDLLTTSDLPGHAMKACDRDRAFGAVLGKALAPLSSGRGLIPVLVSLL